MVGQKGASKGVAMEVGGEGSVMGGGGVREATCSKNVKEDRVQLHPCAD